MLKHLFYNLNCLPVVSFKMSTYNYRILKTKVSKIYRRWIDKLLANRIVTLYPKKFEGRALVAYFPDAFFARGEIPYHHTHFWESREIAMICCEMGFVTDVIRWDNYSFYPMNSYDLVIDVRMQLPRIAYFLPENCIKIQHIETAYYKVNNRGEMRRLKMLEKRKGVRLKPRRQMEASEALAYADCGIVLGNEFTARSYENFEKTILRVPISVPFSFFPFRLKDWNLARKRFIWFGSGGLVHKGLDLVLEAFALLKDLELFICGPVYNESDFYSLYLKELSLPNIHLLDWVDIYSTEFIELLNSVGFIVFPSVSEGGGGSVVHVMHAGVIPIVTESASVDAYWGYKVKDSVESVIETVLKASSASKDELEYRSLKTREFACKYFTRCSFSYHFRRTLAHILDKGASFGSGYRFINFY